MERAIFRKTKSGLRPFPTQLLHMHETKILDFPIFTYKQAKKYIEGLTYRRINFWDSQGFISGYRTKKNTGWRKFSTMDLLKFNIITDLRNLGVSSSFIKNTLDQLENKVLKEDLLIGQEEKTIFFKEIQVKYVRCFEGDKILLSIFRDGLHLILNEKDSFKALPEIYAMTPAIILPFYVYVMRISSLLEHDYSINQESTLLALLKNQLSIKEEAIINAVRNDKYKKIEIIRKNNDHLLITAKSVRSGKFNKLDILDSIDQKKYQSVKVIKENGQIVTISQTERFWI